MRRTWWEFRIGIAVLLLVVMSVNCTLDVSGLPRMKERPDQENAVPVVRVQITSPESDPGYQLHSVPQRLCAFRARSEHESSKE